MLIEEEKEKAPVSLSSSLLLTADYGIVWENRLIMVRQKDNQKWGLIAGKFEYSPMQNLVESTRGTITRELFEETDISLEQIKDLFFLTEIYSPKPQYIGIGFVFQANVSGELRNFERGYTPKNEEEIDRVRGLTIDQISNLVLKHPQKIYKPEYNIPLLQYWAFEAICRKYEAYEGAEFAEYAAEGRTGFSKECRNIHHIMLPSPNY